MLFSNITQIIATVPALVIAFAFHEFAHAWTADRLGDPTPRSMGRLTLNPLAHLDIFGSLMVLISGFGWAKPVMINPRYFKGNPLRGRMMVSVAGPLMNFLVGFVSLLAGGLMHQALHNTSWDPIMSVVFQTIVIINVSIGVFNIVPVPPLDGFAVLMGLLPGRQAYSLMRLEPYGMILLAVLLFTNILSGIIYPLVDAILNMYNTFAVLLLPWIFR